MQNLFAILLISFCIELSAQSSSTSFSLFFDKGESALTPADEMNLDEFISLVKDSTYNAVFIKGYADADGSEASNLELSELRVAAISSRFYGNKYKVESKFYGEKESINKNRNEEEKSLNRRVDLIFWTNYNLFQNKKKPQVFTFSPNRNIEFVAAEGTKIKIPANSLVYADGQAPLGDIQIEITEFYSMTDIIQNKLTTTSNGMLIISDGMININASRNDKDLRLKGGAVMDVGFAEREENDGFGLFYANNNNDNSPVNWVPAVNPSSIEKGWSISNVQLFMDDTIATSKSKFEYNKFGQRIRVTEKWEETKGISYDTLIMDKTINANKIILQATKLGWINCDQYYFKENAPAVEMFVEMENTISPNIVLIFNDKKAMISPSKSPGGQWVFSNVPVGEKVTITGVGSGEGKLYFAKQELVTSSTNVRLDFQESDIATIQNLLSGYD
ncbi:MAG: OmpA family protein [Chitinophagales bacterium]